MQINGPNSQGGGLKYCCGSVGMQDPGALWGKLGGGEWVLLLN